MSHGSHAATSAVAAGASLTATLATTRGAASTVASAAVAGASTTAAAVSSHGGGQTNSGRTNTKALIYRYVNNFPLYWWYAIGAVGGAFMIAHFTRIIHQRIRRNRSIAHAQAASAKGEFEAATSQRSSPLMRGVNTVLSATRKGFSWRQWTIALWWKVTAGELFWSAIYLLMTLLFGMLYMPVNNTTLSAQSRFIANRTGVLAYSQIPLIIGLASKNQVLSYLTGISYEKLNFLHRASSRACLILAWIHSGAYWWIIGMTGRHSLKTSVDMQWGVAAVFAYTLLVIGGLKHVRNAFYELFLLSHIALAMIYLVGCYLHWPRMGYWVYPGFVIWGFDRLARSVNIIVINKLWLSLRPRSTNPACRATVKCIADNALELRIPRSNMAWQAGQHVYVMCPTISWLSAHPFTVASIPPAEKGKTPEVHLIIRECDGFTKNLGKVARAGGGEAEILTCVEGPYGYVKCLQSYESVVLISGGSGISYTLPLLAKMIRDSAAGQLAVRSVAFVWIVPNTDQISWIGRELAELVHTCPSTLTLDLQIYVTRTVAAGVPVLAEKAVDDASSGSSARISAEISRSIPSSSSTTSSDDLDEKAAGGELDDKSTTTTLTSEAKRFARNIRLGRPDFRQLFTEIIAGANGGPMSVNMCGPSGMTADVKATLAARDGPYSLADVASGRVGLLDVHYESFGW